MTVYCSPATGPHGFHTLGRTIESTLRSYNNLLERLHASYFFYLVPKPHHFIPVGHYLPAAIILGASVTFGGFDCPSPLEGVMWMLPAFIIAGIAWIVQSPLVSLVALLLPRPEGDARKSVVSLTHLLYGALTPTLAMVNFPQALLLGLVTVVYLMPPRWVRLGVLGLHPWLATLPGLNLRWEWETMGNMAWPGVFAIWIPLWILSSKM
jgi:glycosylphosphatidylinositol transamidase